MLSGRFTRLLQFSRYKWSFLKFPIFSGISGKLFSFDQPAQERTVRDFKLQMASGRLTMFLQFVRFKYWSPLRCWIDDGTFSIAVPSKWSSLKFSSPQDFWKDLYICFDSAPIWQHRNQTSSTDQCLIEGSSTNIDGSAWKFNSYFNRWLSIETTTEYRANPKKSLFWYQSIGSFIVIWDPFFCSLIHPGIPLFPGIIIMIALFQQEPHLNSCTKVYCKHSVFIKKKS